MELKPSMDDPAPKRPEQPQVEYTAQATSPLVNGEVKIVVGENSFTITALFDAIEIAYAEVNALELVGYDVIVKTDDGNYVLARMGSWGQPFYDALCDAYNRAVLRSLFTKGNPILAATGDYRYAERGAKRAGTAPVQVYENSVVILPPDLSARRVPLCFVSSADKGNYEFTLRLDTDENYTCAKLGHETAPFAEAVEKQIRALREKSLAVVKGLDPSLTAGQAMQLAKLVPQGVAAPIGRLAEIATSFVAALEEKIASTRAADSCKVFQTLCNPAQIYVGFKKNGIKTEADDKTDNRDEAVSDQYLLWLIAPSPDGRYAAVEFAEADTATFVYKTGNDFNNFARQLNRALEAIDFKREAIWLPDEELRKPGNANYYMAAKRTVSLQFVRANFVGRIIHTSLESWRRRLMEMWEV